MKTLNEEYQEQSIKIGLLAKKFEKVIEVVNKKAPEGYFVTMPKSAQDLFDEGYNNHNDVMCYVRKISEEGRVIFFVRKTDEPEKSFITAEHQYGRPMHFVKDHSAKVEETELIDFGKLFCKTAMAYGLAD